MIKKNRKIIAGIMCMLALGMVGTMASKLNLSASSGVGWVQSSSGAWNYNKTDGSKTIGWSQINNDWYYFYSDGTMATGWLQAGGNWYYMLKDGSMAVNIKVDGYYINKDGVYSTGVPASIYNGNDIKQKLTSLGFALTGDGARLNTYGLTGGANFEIMDFNVFSNGDDKDMNLFIFQSNAEYDKKIKTLLNWILPTKGDYLYNVLDDKNLTAQTLELDGRTVKIIIQNYGVQINFSPIK